MRTFIRCGLGVPRLNKCFCSCCSVDLDFDMRNICRSFGMSWGESFAIENNWSKLISVGKSSSSLAGIWSPGVWLLGSMSKAWQTVTSQVLGFPVRRIFFFSPGFSGRGNLCIIVEGVADMWAEILLCPDIMWWLRADSQLNPDDWKVFRVQSERK